VDDGRVCDAEIPHCAAAVPDAGRETERSPNALTVRHQALKMDWAWNNGISCCASLLLQLRCSQSPEIQQPFAAAPVLGRISTGFRQPRFL
jgi:hypothetical protein